MILNSVSHLKEKNDKFENGTSNLTKDSFTFISQLGSGAFGKVYKVSSKLTNNIYALKVLSKNQIANLKLMDQLRNEISILARCNHESIITLHGAFEDKSYIYLIMEFANDATLFSKLKKAKKFSEPLAADYLRDIINAVIYLHSQNPVILHRDLKPENILIANGRCKIADFGWSNVDDEFRNTFCGTPDYLAPEMIVGTGHNEKLDVWTIGILMYELLHGHPPFSPKEKVNDARVMQKIIEKNILDGLIDFDNNVSTEAKNAIRALLNPKDTLRPTAREIIDLEYFKKYAKFLPQGAPNNTLVKSPSRANIDNMGEAALKQRIKDYETRLEGLLATNKNMNEMLESRDNIIKNLEFQGQQLVQKNNKLIEEVRMMKAFDEANGRGDLGGELKRARMEVVKQEEMVNYLFKRNKHLSNIVAEFYHKAVAEQPGQFIPDTNINYETTLMKFESIIREYLKYKTAFTGKGKSEFGHSNIASVNLVTPIRNFSPVYDRFDSSKEKPDDWNRNVIEHRDVIKNYFKKSN
jgi:serine/threonine protein kinase